MEKDKFKNLTCSLTEISNERAELHKKMSLLLKEYKLPIDQVGWEEFQNKKDEILSNLKENDNQYKERLLDILNKIKDESDEVVKQYCDSIMDNFEYFYIKNYDNRLEFICEVNEVIEMYNEIKK